MRDVTLHENVTEQRVKSEGLLTVTGGDINRAFPDQLCQGLADVKQSNTGLTRGTACLDFSFTDIERAATGKKI